MCGPKQAMGIDYQNPICSTTACQDLSFNSKNIIITLSTWEAAGYQVFMLLLMVLC